jgi:hypothetical protein
VCKISSNFTAKGLEHIVHGARFVETSTADARGVNRAKEAHLSKDAILSWKDERSCK